MSQASDSLQLDADYLIIGSGIAGLRAAADLAPSGRVLILTKADPAESNTGYAQGGIAAAIGPDDSPGLHADDTIKAGDGLCDPEAVRVLVEAGPADVRTLIEWGARFDTSADGTVALGREAAHTVRRVLHAADATGREIGRALEVPVGHAVGRHARRGDESDVRRAHGVRLTREPEPGVGVDGDAQPVPANVHGQHRPQVHADGAVASTGRRRHSRQGKRQRIGRRRYIHRARRVDDARRSSGKWAAVCRGG